NIYALTNQGVRVINSSGFQIISRNIDGELGQLYGSTRASLKLYSFAVSHESERLYSLWVPPVGGTYPTRAYVYSVPGPAWYC
ncbi:hypothetical protein VZ147_24860, partial [Enterobacter hormaechei]|uniref:hypothetical protein n=1 Tax=Enterobacter hormaechei TaxID=158836 RepID=UPI002E2CF98E